MEELAAALAAQGEGAGVAVDTANRMVRFAETSHKVLTAAQMVGGVTVLVQTGVTIATQQGYTACAKFAAQAALAWTASATAAAVGNYALDELDVSPETRHWMQVGLDAYQIFAFFKARRSGVQPGQPCFVAGTQVVTGINADGSMLMRNIEEIEQGDTVLSRDQHDETDDLTPRTVTQVFRKTSDHIRTVTIAGDDGNVETIKTTDEHPFYVQGQGWTSADELRIGDFVQETDGTWQAVLGTSREAHPGGITMYNLEVEGDHTYFVEDGFGAADAVWVHNNCDAFQNKINHIFHNNLHDHKMGPFAAAVGSEAKALQALEAATKALPRQRGLSDGLFEEVISIAGFNITVQGNVINGVAKLATAFIP